MSRHTSRLGAIETNSLQRLVNMVQRADIDPDESMSVREGP